MQSHLDAGIIVPPDHGNVGGTPWHAVSAEEVGMVRDFIQNYACVHGVPQQSHSLSYFTFSFFLLFPFPL